MSNTNTNYSRQVSDILNQFQNLSNHDTHSVKHLMEWGIAHESTGGHQFVFRIDVGLRHVLVHVFAAHLTQGFGGPRTGPPRDGRGKETGT